MTHCRSLAAGSLVATRRGFLRAGAGAAWLAGPGLSRAEAAWPSRPVRIVVPFTPGGTTDVVTRLVATPLARQFGQPFVIDNRPGAGTVIGVDAVAKAPADGYTFVTVANSFCVNQTLVKSLPYGGSSAFRPVALMGMSEHVLAAHPGAGIRSVADLREAARKGASLSYASFGAGTSAHLSGEMLKSAMGLDIVHLPYKGQAPALSDLLGGQVTMMFGNWSEFRDHVRGGRLVAIGMATRQRSVYAPDIPTLAEQGVAIESNSWNGLLARAGTSDEVVQRMNEEVNRALATPAVAKAFHEGGIASLSGTPSDFDRFIAAETERYAAVIRRAHITV